MSKKIEFSARLNQLSANPGVVISFHPCEFYAWDKIDLKTLSLKYEEKEVPIGSETVIQNIRAKIALMRIAKDGIILDELNVEKIDEMLIAFSNEI